MPISEGVGDRRVGVRDTEICRLPKATVGQILKRGTKEWGAEDECGYFEQVVPLGNNLTEDIGAAEYPQNIIFIEPGTRGASGLVSDDTTKVQKAFLIILGVAVNTYDGNNALSTGGDDNVWQIDVDEGGFQNLSPDGQMANGSWRTPVKGTIYSFPYQFDISDQLTNVDGKIGLQLKDGLAVADTLVTTISAFLKLLWRL